MGVEVRTYGREVKRLVASIAVEEVDRTANLVLREARRDCPIESVESVIRRRSSGRARRYGAARGAARRSGRIVRFRKNGVYGAYVKFGGVVVNGVDTYYLPFVELGTPGTTFRSKKGYWGHKGIKTRVAIQAKPFLRTANKRQKSKHLQRMKARLS